MDGSNPPQSTMDIKDYYPDILPTVPKVLPLDMVEFTYVSSFGNVSPFCVAKNLLSGVAQYIGEGYPYTSGKYPYIGLVKDTLSTNMTALSVSIEPNQNFVYYLGLMDYEAALEHRKAKYCETLVPIKAQNDYHTFVLNDPFEKDDNNACILLKLITLPDSIEVQRVDRSFELRVLNGAEILSQNGL